MAKVQKIPHALYVADENGKASLLPPPKEDGMYIFLFVDGVPSLVPLPEIDMTVVSAEVESEAVESEASGLGNPETVAQAVEEVSKPKRKRSKKTAEDVA